MVGVFGAVGVEGSAAMQGEVNWLRSNYGGFGHM